MPKKIKCVRCGFKEFPSSLHIHHLDENHENNAISNLIVLCSNCHFGLHQKKWNITDIGIYVIKNKKSRILKRRTRRYLKEELVKEIKEDKNEITNYKIEIKELNIALNELNNEIRYSNEKYESEISRLRIKIMKMYDIVKTYDYDIFYELMELK